MNFQTVVGTDYSGPRVTKKSSKFGSDEQYLVFCMLGVQA